VIATMARQLSLAPVDGQMLGFEILGLLQAGSEPTVLIKSHPFCALPMAHEIVELVVRQMRLSRTNDCYDTNGGISAKGYLVDQSKRWDIKPNHKTLLEKLFEKHQGKRHGVLKDVFSLDIALRLHRAKKFKQSFVVDSAAREGYVYDITFQKAGENKEETPVVPVWFRV
jgi:hypothetical protein